MARLYMLYNVQVLQKRQGYLGPGVQQPIFPRLSMQYHNYTRYSGQNTTSKNVYIFFFINKAFVVTNVVYIYCPVTVS